MAITSSIIIPAYREHLNLRPLITRIFTSYPHPQELEVLIIDDNSQDGSVELVSQLQKEGYNVQIVVRTKERGLSSAVVHGFDLARGEKLVCMDADLQVGSSLERTGRVARIRE